MKTEHGETPDFNREKRLLEKMRSHPGMMERFEAIMDLTEASTRTADQIEELLVAEVRRLGNKAMQEWAQGVEEQGAQDLQQRTSGASVRKKKILSWWCSFGAVCVEERIWRAPGQSYLRPFTARTGISARGKSRRLQRVLCDFGAEHSFRQCDQRLKEHYGFELNATAARAATLQHAVRAATQLEAHYRESFRVLPKTGPEYIVAETDGTMICTVPVGGRRTQKRSREWKEMRLSAARAHGSVDTTYAAGFLSVEETGRRWGHCARDAGWSLSAQIHVVADSAEWIRRQCAEAFGDQAELLMDFFHVSEYLAAAAPSCRAKAPRTWLHTQQQRLRRGAADKVLEALVAFMEPAAVSDDEAPVRQAHGYLSRRLLNLDYPKALARKLPIGSGLIESGHKHVLQARLKKPGSAWLPHNAHAIAQLRVVRANQLWEIFWQDRKAA